MDALRDFKWKGGPGVLEAGVVLSSLYVFGKTFKIIEVHNTEKLPFEWRRKMINTDKSFECKRLFLFIVKREKT